MASQSDVSYGTIVKIEQGRQDPRGETIRKLAEALNVSADDILGVIHPVAARRAPPDSLDEIVGWAPDAEPVDDIDEVIYGS